MLLLLLLASVCSAQPYADELIARARAQRVASERPWLALLHYKRGESQADGPGFFLAREGKRDAQAELEADLRAFFDAAPPEPAPADASEPARWSAAQSAQCRFPARYHFLKRRLSIDAARLPDLPCPRFELWRSALDAESVSLVFADAFLNNPSSMYGHTFLRLKRRGGTDGLLDYTINFAGNPDTENALFYALKGVVGLFPGTYSTMPYYMKVQEYTNIESRDLWEYDLALSTEAVDQLVRHAWEMGSTYFDYYFFSENCSYQLLTLLEGADPSIRVSDRFGFGTIPANTVRALLPLAKARRLRPSHVREMLARRAQVRPADLPLADTLDLPRLASLPPGRQAAVIDAGYEYLRYKHGFQDKPLPGERELLVARGKLGLPATPPTMDDPAPLESGHETFRVGAGGGVSTWGIFDELSMRWALHDLAADERGYAAGSQLEMGAVRARFDHRTKRPYIERLALVDIVSLAPLDRWVKKPSWRVSAGAERAVELGRAPADSLVADVSPGVGAAFEPALPLRPLAFAFAEADLGQSRNLRQDWRLGAGASAGLLLRPAPWWRLLAEAQYTEYWQVSPHRERLKLTSAWSLWRNGELRVTLDRRTPDSEAGAYLLVYF